MYIGEASGKSGVSLCRMMSIQQEIRRCGLRSLIRFLLLTDNIAIFPFLQQVTRGTAATPVVTLESPSQKWIESGRFVMDRADSGSGGNTYREFLVQLVGKERIGQLSEVELTEGAHTVNVLDVDIFSQVWDLLGVKLMSRREKQHGEVIIICPFNYILPLTL